MKPAENKEKFDGVWLEELFTKHPKKKKKELGRFLCHYFAIKESYASGLITRILKNERTIKANEVAAILMFFESAAPLQHTKAAESDTITMPFQGKSKTESKEWSLPRSVFSKGEIPENLKALRVTGDSMAPDIRDGDSIVFSQTDKSPSPAGIFVINDGAGLILANIKLLMGTKTPTARVSFANKKYDSSDIALSKIDIKGRVILKICGV